MGSQNVPPFARKTAGTLKDQEAQRVSRVTAEFRPGFPRMVESFGFTQLVAGMNDGCKAYESDVSGLRSHRNGHRHRWIGHLLGHAICNQGRQERAEQDDGPYAARRRQRYGPIRLACDTGVRTWWQLQCLRRPEWRRHFGADDRFLHRVQAHLSHLEGRSSDEPLWADE
jgi:hypothetical protein